MKRILVIATALLAFAVSAGAQYYSNLDRYAAANAEVLASGVKPKAVFMGDSITDGWYCQDPEFFASNNFVGRGIGGQVTSEILLRFHKDVVELSPKYVVILCGVNDIAENRGPISLDYTLANLAAMVEMAKAARIKPIICKIFPGPKIGWRTIPDQAEKAAKLNEMIAEYAKSSHIPCVEYFKDIEKPGGSLPVELSGDSIHPNLDGYKIIEKEILKYLK